MKIFDPLGFVLPTKMIGNLLFRITLQRVKKERKGGIPWDEHLPEDIHGEWLQYFSMLFGLKNVRFPRACKPSNVNEEFLSNNNSASLNVNCYSSIPSAFQNNFRGDQFE